MTKACNSCTYFEHEGNGVTSDKNAGACRINPPSASDLDKIAFWPVVKSSDWCGSFETKYS